MTKQISLAEVKKHNNKDSLWIVIHNDVYDVTSYLGEHPGGEDTLLENAGQDGTQNFEDVGHSEDARTIMKKFKIGTLPPGEKIESADKKCRGSLPRSHCKEPLSPRVERRLQSIVVPRERLPRGRSCERGHERTQSSSSPSRCKIKWAILALGGAIVIGIVLKKYMS